MKYKFKYKELPKEVQEVIEEEYLNNLVKITNFEELPHNTYMYKAYKRSIDDNEPAYLAHYIWIYCEHQIVKELNKGYYDEKGNRYK